MAFTRSPLSLSLVNTKGASAGRGVWLPRAASKVTATVTVTASTKAVVALKGSVDGVNWKQIGSANTTCSSGVTTITASTTFVYQHLRIDQVSASTKVGGYSIVGSITGV